MGKVHTSVFRMRFEPIPLEKGTIYYCCDGAELWQWHIVVDIDEETRTIWYSWCTDRQRENGMWVADPLSADLDRFKEELVSEEWKLVRNPEAASEHRIPLPLLAYRHEIKI